MLGTGNSSRDLQVLSYLNLILEGNPIVYQETELQRG